MFSLSILSVVGSTQHELAKWLSEILAPVLQLYSGFFNYILGSFFLLMLFKTFNLIRQGFFMCSFGISLWARLSGFALEHCTGRGEGVVRPSFLEKVFALLMEPLLPGW